MVKPERPNLSSIYCSDTLQNCIELEQRNDYIVHLEQMIMELRAEVKGQSESFRKSYNLIIQSVNAKREELETRVAELDEWRNLILRVLHEEGLLSGEQIVNMKKIVECELIHKGYNPPSEPDDNKKAPGQEEATR